MNVSKLGWLGIFFMVSAGTCVGMPSAEVDAPIAVPFDEEHWQLAGSVVEHLGRQALRGGATLNEVTLGDGVIDVDLAVDGRRSFPGIRFRVQDPQNAEIFYLRPHRNRGYGHALQYTPVFNGMTGWQLYAGAGFTAPAEIPADEWVHVRIELSGDRARIYFGDLDRPALVVDRLVRGDAPGGISLIGGGAGGQVHWSDFRYRQADDLDFGPRPIRAPASDMLREWQVSQVFPLAAVDRMRPPEKQELDEISWQTVDAEDTGLVNLSRVLALPRGVIGCAFARTVIEMDEAAVKRLDFGYSDEVTVLLNGTPLFSGASSFRQRDVEFMGVIGLNDTLYLNLAKGSNELVFTVAEGFGGWGLMARLAEPPSGPVTLHERVSLGWQNNDGWQMPESVAVDGKRGVVYVSNFSPTGADMGQTGFICRLGLDGRLKEDRWTIGLRAPTGIALRGDQLLVVERTGLAMVDVDSGEISNRSEVEGAAFLNDVAVAEDGTVYVSDSRAGKIYEVVDGQWSVWSKHPNLVSVNGLCVDGNEVVAVTVETGMMVFIDRSTRTVKKIIDISPSVGDGIVALGGGRYLVTDYNGRILLVEASGKITELVDRTATSVACADLDADPSRDMVVVPAFYGNSVTAFRVRDLLN